ncbi:MAG: mandelate racemase/muconate lactonizing enzyme family protein [Anaerolineae bacterium]|nr:mandelate racemase/muconate lactonizing enzyme family protein [Anaerolineae bacterium]
MQDFGCSPHLHKVLPDPVILTSIEGFQFQGHRLVRVTAADGASGVVVVNDRLAYLWPILERFVLPCFIGKDARDLPSLVEAVYTYRSAYKLSGIALWCPVAYVELSVLDLLGQLTHQPAGRLLGSVVREQIPIYLSSGNRDTTPNEEVAWLSDRLTETNARAVKLKIGGRMSQNADASPGRTDRLIPLARQTFGDDVTIYVDANGSYDADHAIEVAALLADYGVAFLEEPCPWQDYWKTKRVADALALPVAGGEQDSSLPTFDWMIRDRVVDVVQPDMMYNGGLMRCLRVAEMAAAAGIPVMPHSPKVGAEAAAVVQFGSITPNLGPHQEWNARQAAPVSWYSPSFGIVDGVVPVPEGPGLGVTYDVDIWEKAERVF